MGAYSTVLCVLFHYNQPWMKQSPCSVDLQLYFCMRFICIEVCSVVSCCAWKEKTLSEIFPLFQIIKKPKPRGLSLQANYTDRVTAALADRGCHVVNVMDPNGRILGFLYHYLKDCFLKCRFM
jgi:hypothetical protein